MTDSFRTQVWMQLARELSERRNVRPEVRDALKRALAAGDEEAVAAASREVLAHAVADEARSSDRARRTRAEDDAGQRRAETRARQSLALVEHGLARLASGQEVVSPRLCAFLRDQITHYSRAVGEASPKAELVAPYVLSERVLEAVSEHQVMARPVRVGILTPHEIAEIESGSRDPAASTVRSTGDLAADLAAWERSLSVDEARKQALHTHTLEDGQYLLTIIAPTADGNRVEVHPITQSGETVPEPIETFVIPAREEPVPAVQMIIEPAVRSAHPAPRTLAPRIGDQAKGPALTGVAGMKAAAVALNQARLNLYAKILDGRGDLDGRARGEAERQLQRMQAESEQLAHEQEPTRLAAFLAKWDDELTRDMQRLLQASPGREDGLDALSRLGALRHRLDSVRASADGVERKQRALRSLGREEHIFARPAPEPLSIFEGLSGHVMAPGARDASAKTVVGESLVADVIARDATRSAKPSQSTRQLVAAIRAGGLQLQKALTTTQTVQTTGLALSSELRPLLRSAMPSDIRPDLRSPLMRQILLPALERVSGSRRTMARATAQRSAPAGPALTPEALYGMMLGQTGIELVDRRPEIARNVLSQLAGLASSLESSGIGATAGNLMRAGQALIDKVTSLINTGSEPGVVDEQEGSSNIAGGLAVEAMGMAATAGQVAGDVIEDVSGALEAEGAALSSALKDKITPFLPGAIPYGQRVFQGSMTDVLLTKMGAHGATVGGDIFMKSDLSAQQKTAVAAHELAHVTQAAGGSVESLEEEAYAVESKVRDFLSGVELAADEPRAPGQPKATDKPKEEGKQDMALEAIADQILRWKREAAEYASLLSSGTI